MFPDKIQRAPRSPPAGQDENKCSVMAIPRNHDSGQGASKRDQVADSRRVIWGNRTEGDLCNTYSFFFI